MWAVNGILCKKILNWRNHPVTRAFDTLSGRNRTRSGRNRTGGGSSGYLFIFCSHLAPEEWPPTENPTPIAAGRALVAAVSTPVADHRVSSIGRARSNPTCGTQSRCLEAKRQTVCKPGSVPPRSRGGDGHSSGTFVAERLARPTRAAARQARPAAPAKHSSRRRLPLLLGLAPGGVYPAAAVAGGAVRSYRTISPLPPMPSHATSSHWTTGLGGMFLWHFPWGRPRRALPGTVPPWSPDFPPPADPRDKPESRSESGHPTVWHGMIWDRAPTAANRRAESRIRSIDLVETTTQAIGFTASAQPRRPVRAWLGADPCGDSADHAGIAVLHWATAPGLARPVEQSSRRKADGV